MYNSLVLYSMAVFEKDLSETFILTTNRLVYDMNPHPVSLKYVKNNKELNDEHAEEETKYVQMGTSNNVLNLERVYYWKIGKLEGLITCFSFLVC